MDLTIISFPFYYVKVIRIAIIFGSVTSVVNQGIYVASQSQILERTPMEILGNIILNGSDALTITAVLGYMAQKFMTK